MSDVDVRTETHDEGFSLLEVVVSLGMLAVISAAALGFFLSGVRDTAQLQRRQTAVALTSAQLENVRGLPAGMVTHTPATGPSSTYTALASGRAQAAVDAQWGSTGPSATWRAFQPGLAANAAPVVPLSTTSTVSGETYTTQVLIGTCYRQRSNTSSACATTAPTRPETTPEGYAEMVRVVATTTWDPGAGSTCRSSGCSYTSSVLVDPSVDPSWTTTGGEAVDDVADAPRGRTTRLDVLRNDSVVPRSSSPISISTPPGAGATATAMADGTVELAVPAGATGTLSFQYQVHSTSGTTTAPATVRITVVAS